MIGIPDNSVVQKLISTLVLGLVLWCATLAAPAADLPSFCERLPRPAYAAFEKHAASNDWFEVYEIAPGIFALYEPYQWQLDNWGLSFASWRQMSYYMTTFVAQEVAHMTTEIAPFTPKSRTRKTTVDRATTQAKSQTLSRAGVSTKPKPASRRRLGVRESGHNPLPFATNLSPLQAHDLVTEGLPVATARDLMASFQFIDRDVVLGVLGISKRTLERGKAGGKLLNTNASDRALRLASVREQAINVLGSQEAAERWLSTPAMGLDQRIPIGLLQSSEGTDLVKTLLTRMDYGIYA